MTRAAARSLRLLRGLACAAVSLLAGESVRAQAARDSAWRITGSYLNLLTRSRTVVPPAESYALDLNRLRLRLEATAAGSIGLDVQYDSELLLGDYLATPQYALTRGMVTTSLDLEREYLVRRELVARHGLYRAVMTWSPASTDVKVGRQRIPLGTGFFWSPMDLLNPIDPTRVEREYRTGADAVVVEQKLGALGRLTGIYVPHTSRLAAVGAAYAHGNLRGADYSVLAGDFRGDAVLGADISTSRGGLGLRGEATTTRSAAGQRYARVLVGADYGFTNTVRLTGEAYHNGRGATDPARYDVAGVLSGRVLSVARWYAGGSASYEVTPLVKVGAYGVVNASDGSTVLWPRLEWSVRPNLDLAGGVQLFAGARRSEYGRLDALLHSEARWYF